MQDSSSEAVRSWDMHLCSDLSPPETGGMGAMPCTAVYVYSSRSPLEHQVEKRPDSVPAILLRARGGGDGRAIITPSLASAVFPSLSSTARPSSPAPPPPPPTSVTPLTIARVGFGVGGWVCDEEGEASEPAAVPVFSSFRRPPLAVDSFADDWNTCSRMFGFVSAEGGAGGGACGDPFRLPGRVTDDGRHTSCCTAHQANENQNLSRVLRNYKLVF